MLIKYRFRLAYNSTTVTVNPLYDGDLSKDFELETGQRFFREKISGSLTFIGDDFDTIDSQNFETDFTITIQKSDDGGSTYADYWTGQFWKTDGDWDEDNKRFEVTPDVQDQYNNVLAGMDKEFNLVKLLPAKTEVELDKRAMLQTYAPGDSVVGCFMGGLAWEQEVTGAESDTGVLTGTYYFGLASSILQISVSGSGLPSAIAGDYVAEGNWSDNPTLWNSDRSYRIDVSFTSVPAIAILFEIKSSDGVTTYFNAASTIAEPTTLNFTAVSGSGTYTGAVTYQEIYARILTDATSFVLGATSPLPTDDLVPYNRNYRRVYPWAVNFITPTLERSSTPTEYGLTEDGDYYTPPSYFPTLKYYPLARSAWGNYSIWGYISTGSWQIINDASQTYTLKDATRIDAVLSSLLAEIDSSISHIFATTYSDFLYNTVNPVNSLNPNFRVLITQKTNITAGEYDRPAQKSPITLGQVLDMLRTVYQCYWYIDSSNRFRVEHVSWFKNGGAYTGAPTVGADLTTLEQPKNSQKWALNTSKYSFDLEDMPERIEFSWMDEVTLGFDGYPIEIDSNYVLPGSIEKINTGNFTSDIDFMLLNPLSINPDGFALICATYQSSKYVVPYEEFTIEGGDVELQNPYASWIYIHPEFWDYDLPAEDVTINETTQTAAGVRRTKKQTVWYPSTSDPDPMELIKTYLGDGEIEKISVNLSSRMNTIELRYDPE